MSGGRTISLAPHRLVPATSSVQRFVPARWDALRLGNSPLLAIYKSGDRTLVWAAIRHGEDPSTLRLIGAAIRRFRPGRIILEGIQEPRIKRVPKATGCSAEIRTAIIAGFSVGAVLSGGEADDANLYRHLLRDGFQPREIFFSSLLLPLEQDHREGRFGSLRDGPFLARFEYWFEMLAPVSNWGDGCRPGDFIDWCQQYYAPGEEGALWAGVGPGADNRIGHILTATNLFRDRTAYGRVIGALQRHRSVMSVFGSSHLANQWPALRAALGVPVIARS